MKKLAFLVLMIGLSIQLFAQTDYYTVLKVKGVVKLKKSGKVLKTQDKISSEDQVQFGSNDAIAALHSPQKGRFTLRAAAKSGSGNALLAYVKNALFPSTERLSSRKAKQIEFNEEFESPYNMIKKAEVKFKTEEYPQNIDSYFAFIFSVKGKKVEKKLAVSTDQVVIDKKEVISTKGLKIKDNQPQEVKLVYKTGKDEKVVKEFKINFINEKELKNELELYIESLKSGQMPAPKIKEAITTYMTEYYGKVNENEFKEWLKANLNY